MFGPETQGGSFPSLYRALVVDVRDPERRGRVKATILGAHQEEPHPMWIEPAFLGAGANRGFFFPPEEGDSILVGFQYGNPDRPELYLGGWYGRGELPAELGYDSAGLPRRRGFVTRGGHSVVFDDTPGAERVQVTWRASAAGDAFRTRRDRSASRSAGQSAELTFATSGVTLRSASGSSVEMLTDGTVRITSSAGAKITLSGSELVIETPAEIQLKAPSVKVAASSVELGTGAGHPSVRGDALLFWCATHTHGGLPPTTPPPATILSPRVRVP